MKKLFFLLLSLMLATTSAAFAVTGGDNQVLPGTNVNLPARLGVAWEDVQLITVPYKTLENGQQLSMLLCLPPESACADMSARPCIVMTRGSGLRAVSLNDYTARPNDQQLVRAMMLAKHGYVVAAIEFRGYTSEPAGMGTFPAALQDCRAAVRFLKASAEEYGLDVTRFASIGQSSGGYESAMLGVTLGIWGVEVPDDSEGAAIGARYYSEAEADAAIAEGKNVVKLDTTAGDIHPNAAQYDSSVIASVDLYGIAKIDDIGGAEHQHTLSDNTAQEEVCFMTGSNVTEIWDAPYVHTAANPFWYINESTGARLSMLFAHGLADDRVYPDSTATFYAVAQQNNVPAYRFLIPGAGHGGNRFVQDDLYTLLLDFFGETLKGETGHRVLLTPVEGGDWTVLLNGEDVTCTPWKLSNLTASDTLTVSVTAQPGYTFAGMTVESIDSTYTVECKTVYTATCTLTGESNLILSAAFTAPAKR